MYHLLQRIKTHKSKGDVSFAITLPIVVLIVIVICYVVASKYMMVVKSNIADDCLVTSNLASLSTKNMDLDFLSLNPDSSQLTISSLDDARDTFIKHLQLNLSLDDTFRSSDYAFIKGQVIIKSLIFYNVYDNGDVSINEYLEGSDIAITTLVPNGKGVIITPKGNIIEATGVHSEIEFPIQSIFKRVITVTVSEDNDILSE